MGGSQAIPTKIPYDGRMAIADLDPVAGGQASGRARRARAIERAARAEIVDTITNGLEREQIGPALLQMAAKLAHEAATAHITVDNAYERKATAETAKILHTMGRLELGESTNNTATFAVQGDRDAKVAELEARLAAMRGEQGR